MRRTKRRTESTVRMRDIRAAFPSLHIRHLGGGTRALRLSLENGGFIQIQKDNDVPGVAATAVDCCAYSKTGDMLNPKGVPETIPVSELEGWILLQMRLAATPAAGPAQRTTSMQKMTNERAQQLRADIDKALAAIAERHGLQSLSTGPCEFTDERVRVPLDGIVNGGRTAEEQAYDELRAQWPGLPARGTVLTFDSREYIVYGKNPRGQRIILTEKAEPSRSRLCLLHHLLSLK